jgi:hypothetical protein
MFLGSAPLLGAVRKAKGAFVTQGRYIKVNEAKPRESSFGGDNREG